MPQKKGGGWQFWQTKWPDLYEHPYRRKCLQALVFFCYLKAFFSFLGNQWLFNFWDKEQ
jgi:hypothetical protein